MQLEQELPRWSRMPEPQPGRRKRKARKSYSKESVYCHKFVGMHLPLLPMGLTHILFYLFKALEWIR